MSERPIIFSAPMVRALLDGRKTQTRRILKPQHASAERAVRCSPESRTWDFYSGDYSHRQYHGAAHASAFEGDRLWVREVWADLTETHGQRWERRNPETQLYERGVRPFIWYRADGDQPCMGDGRPLDEPWRSPIHMPRWASRITLEVTEVRVQRLQEISEEDARAEGVEAISVSDVPRQAAWSCRQDFARLWGTIHGPGAWEASPWVAAISFKRVQP